MTHEEKIIEHLKTEQMLSVGELDCLLTTEDTETVEKLKAEARMAAQSVYGKQIYIRGLIEFTNYCKNDCYYCGIRRGNACAERYRLTEEQILSCCATGYELGFRTFVLQGGEDPYFTDEKICGLVSAIKQAYPDCAVTLSIGEKERASYQAYFDAGADRYLLRHETADAVHYGKLHGGNRTVHSAEGHAVWRGDCGDVGDDPAAAFHPAADESACAASGDDGARHDPPAGKGNGNSVRRQCGDAESLAGFRAGKI